MYWPLSNGRRVAVETDPEVGQGLVLVLAPHQCGVVLGRIGVDRPGVGQELGHVGMVPGLRAHIGRMTDASVERSLEFGAMREIDRERLRGYTPMTMSSALRVVRCPLLIGRDDLLDLVDRRLDDVVAGHGQFLLLAGQAGIGKTRFLDAIYQKAEARGFITMGGAVAPQDHDVPAASILDMARSMLRAPALASVGERLLELDRAVATGENIRRRRFVTEAVEVILTGLPSPAMLAFEDLHWADDVSLEIIAELARQ